MASSHILQAIHETTALVRFPVTEIRDLAPSLKEEWFNSSQGFRDFTLFLVGSKVGISWWKSLEEQSQLDHGSQKAERGT